MVELFRDFWWLVFPLAWMLSGAVTSFLNYRRQQKALDVIRAYADRGQEPPAAVMAAISTPIDADAAMWNAAGSSTGGRPTNYWSLFGLFGVLAAGFGAAAAFPGLLGLDFGTRFPFTVVAMVMGATAVWAFICAVTQRPGGRS